MLSGRVPFGNFGSTIGDLGFFLVMNITCCVLGINTDLLPRWEVRKRDRKSHLPFSLLGEPKIGVQITLMANS